MRLQLFGLDLALELRAAEVVEKRLRFGSQPIGFPLERRAGDRTAARRRPRCSRGQASARRPRERASMRHSAEHREPSQVIVSYRVEERKSIPSAGDAPGARHRRRAAADRPGDQRRDRGRWRGRSTTWTVERRRRRSKRVVREIGRLAAEEDGLAAIVVGVPLRLDGSPNEANAATWLRSSRRCASGRHCRSSARTNA